MPSRARVSAGLHRAVLAQHLQALLERLDVGLVVDVGAHEGEYGLLLRGIGYEGPIASIEPVPASFDRLAERARSDGRWSARQLAVGAGEGVAEIGVAESTDLSSLLPATTYGAEVSAGRITATHHVRVDVCSLDRLRPDLDAERRGRDVLLKIDVQGLELEVLAGAVAWLADVAAVQVEAAVQPIYARAPRFEDVFAALEPRGFALTGVVPVTRDPALRIVELDCVFARPELLMQDAR